MSRTTIEPSSVDGAPSTETLRLQNQVFPDVHGHNPAASQNSDAKEDDESPLAYALRHGLGTDHPHHNPYASMRELKRSFCETHRAFKHPSRTPSPHKEFELKERLVVNTEVAQFLREIMVTPELPEQFDQEPSDSRPKPKRDDLKTEPPLLRSDSELDTPHRGRPPVPDLKKLSTTIPLIPEREEDDENLEYEAGVLDKIRRRGKAVETEKLEVPGEACRFLRTVLREHCDSADEEEFVASEIHRPRFEEVAHPLRPGVLSPIPFEPPPAGHVGLVSTESCPQDLRLSNAQLAKHDTLNKSLSDVVPPVNTELGLAHDDGHESETAEWSHARQSIPVPSSAANDSQGNKELRVVEKSFASDRRHTTYINPVLDGMFSVSTALAVFMQGQGIQVTKQSHDFPADPTRRPHTVQSPNAINCSDPSGDLRESNIKQRVISSLPMPSLPSPLPTTTIILSSILFSTQRSLITELKHLYTDLSFIERDFSSLKPPLGNEADIITSPSTGLVLTTLQKIKQKPLPGQERLHYGIKERLIDLSVRYERLIVLVAERSSVSDAARDLDDNDCFAMSDMMGFAAALDAGVQVLYVPGGNKELANWTACCIAQFRFDFAESIGQTGGQQEPRLIEDETLWEQFLRRAGLNAFAAQVVLAELREPDAPCPSTGCEVSSSDTYLSAFVRMRPDERIRRFEILLGGRKVLARVNQALEQTWPAKC